MAMYLDKYRGETARNANYDYGARGLYFITICTHQMNHYFGDISYDDSVGTGDCPSFVNMNDGATRTGNRPSLRMTDIGMKAKEYWEEIPNHYPFVELDDFVIMPNHLHGILFINKPFDPNWKPNQFGIQSRNLGAIIRAYKSSVKRFANQNNIDFHWQPRYHERIIRGQSSLHNIRNYIQENPVQWVKDNGIK